MHITQNKCNTLLYTLVKSIGKEATRYRKPIKNDERIISFTSILCGLKWFRIGGHHWKQGKTTVFDCLLKFIDCELN